MHKYLVLLALCLCLVTSLDAFTPGADSIDPHPYRRYEYYIPMRDGTKLFTAVYVPADTIMLHPILMVRTPYGSGPYGEDKMNYYMTSLLDSFYVHRKYILVYQDVRGRFMSEGTYVNVRPYIPQKKSNMDIDESSDTYDTVDWLVKNIKGNNGRVGMKGISYPGFYTWMGTIDAHPAMKATSPQAPVSQWMGCDDFFHNGAFLLSAAYDFLNWFGWPRKDTTRKDFRTFTHSTPDGYEFFMNVGALPNVNTRYFHDSVALWNEMMNHGTWDSFWQERSVLPHLKNLRPATLVIGGWYHSEDLYGTLKSFSAAEQFNPQNNIHLLMGPWAHSYWIWPNLDSLGYIKYGSPTTNYYMEQIEGPFFKYYLNNGPNPNLAKATVFLTGANEWKTFDSLPPTTVEQQVLFLNENSSASFTKKPSKKEFDEYISDPAKPVPYTSQVRHWYNVAFPVEDQRFAAKRSDVLVYKSEPLPENVTIAGPMTVELYGSTSGTDCDWIVKVIDVFPDSVSTPRGYPDWVKFGGYQMMVRGEVLRGKFRNSLAKPEPITPNTPTKFVFELQDVFHCIKKGHCLMVQIQSTWFPLIDRNPGIFMDIYKASDSDFHATTQRVYHSEHYPTCIKFSVLK